MKKASKADNDELRKEYDLSQLGAGVQRKYYHRAIAEPVSVKVTGEPGKTKSASRASAPESNKPSRRRPNGRKP